MTIFWIIVALFWGAQLFDLIETPRFAAKCAVFLAVLNCIQWAIEALPK